MSSSQHLSIKVKQRLLLFILMLLLNAVFGVLLHGTAEAMRTRITSGERVRFAAATQEYWDSHIGPPNVLDVRTDHYAIDYLGDAKCKPNNVKILYYSSSNPPANLYIPNKHEPRVQAFGSVSAAFSQEVQERRHILYEAQYYCKMWFNRANNEFQTAPTNSALLCETFIHEYGHMLGLAKTESYHVNNKESVMFWNGSLKTVHTPCD